MYKKGAILILIVLMSAFVLAQSNSSITNSSPSSSGTTSSVNTNVIDKAYQCLQAQINNRDSNSLSLQELVFGVLALGGSNSNLVSKIDSKIVEGNHWAESTSPIKDTAQVLLAYKRISKNTDSIRSWLDSNRKTATDLTWYLEIDIENQLSSQCTVKKGTDSQTITVHEDMTLSGAPSACLTIAHQGFWLKVSNSCIDQNFTITCDHDFTTSTLYQRTGSETFFVTPTAHSATLGGQTQESFNSNCFSASSSGCDYEGTLWAAVALDTLNKDTSDYLPYLLALSEANQKYLPSAFLYILTNGQEQYSELTQLQQQSKYWQAPNTVNNRFYDSALALLALKSSNSAEFSNSRTYFESVTSPDGCWNENNIRDTGFLLYAGWPRTVSSGTGQQSNDCGSQSYSCVPVPICDEIGGEIYAQYDCSTGVCCSKSPIKQSCQEQGGQLCGADESCSGSSAQSSEGTCCLATCEPASQQTACEISGGICSSSCSDQTNQIGESCEDTSQVCCKANQVSKSGTNWVLWIILLIILIALAVVGIKFKDKIRLMLYKKSQSPPSSYKPGFPPGGRPPFPPASGAIPFKPQQRMISPQGSLPAVVNKPRQTPEDKEIEETMRKLKDMGK